MTHGAQAASRRRMDPTERRTLTGCALSAAVLLLAPGEFVSAGVCLAVAIGFGVHHLLATRAEGRAAQAPPPPAPDAGNPMPPLAAG